jgi:DNA-binding beta-propeller fold protein YncE
MRSVHQLATACACGLALLQGGAALAQSGALTQLPGTAACVSEGGSDGICAEGVALNAPVIVAVSPDGRNVYAATFGSSSVAVFARDRRTGALTQLPGTAACISEDGTGGACLDGVALEGTRTVALSRDGRNAYVTSFVSDAVAVFARDRSGRTLAAR